MKNQVEVVVLGEIGPSNWHFKLRCPHCDGEVENVGLKNRIYDMLCPWCDKSIEVVIGREEKMPKQIRVPVTKVSQTGHITALFFWTCTCGVKNCTMGFPDDIELLDQCSICRQEVVVEI